MPVLTQTEADRYRSQIGELLQWLNSLF
jgi:hypothetical protein